MNTFGERLRLSTFGESHGAAIGGVLDGFPAGVAIEPSNIQSELDRRKPGGKYATPRKEADEIEILSGIFDGRSTGAPIGFIIRNANQHSKDYENLKDIFRPAHADFSYFAKYGLRDYRGGGRASARETAVRVAAGAFVQILLNHFKISVKSGVCGVGEIYAGNLDFDFAQNSEIFALDPAVEGAQKELILSAKNAGDSIGGCVLTRVTGVPAGLGEPLYGKLDAALAGAMMGINGVKAVQIGAGVKASTLKGSENNDFMCASNDAIRTNGGKIGANFASNNAGGILGGISSGTPIEITTHFKPTPSIFMAQRSVDVYGADAVCELRGRHDPCIAVRGSVVATAMARLAIADALLLNASATLGNLKRIYGED